MGPLAFLAAFFAAAFFVGLVLDLGLASTASLAGASTTVLGSLAAAVPLTNASKAPRVKTTSSEATTS